MDDRRLGGFLFATTLLFGRDRLAHQRPNGEDARHLQILMDNLCGIERFIFDRYRASSFGLAFWIHGAGRGISAGFYPSTN